MDRFSVQPLMNLWSYVDGIETTKGTERNSLFK